MLSKQGDWDIPPWTILRIFMCWMAKIYAILSLDNKNKCWGGGGGWGDIFSSTFHLLSFSIMWHEYTLSHNFHCFSVNSKISQSFKKCPSQFPAKTISQPIPRFPSHVPVSSKIPQSFLPRFQDFPVRSKQSQSFPSLNISLSFPSQIHFPTKTLSQLFTSKKMSLSFPKMS